MLELPTTVIIEMFISPIKELRCHSFCVKYLFMINTKFGTDALENFVVDYVAIEAKSLHTIAEVKVG